MARQHGVPRVANRLRLNAVFLRKRMEGATGEVPTEVAEPEFVELATMPALPVPAAAWPAWRTCATRSGARRDPGDAAHACAAGHCGR